VDRLRLELCPVGRADPPLPQAHWRQTVQVSPLRAMFLQVRPFGAAQETALHLNASTPTHEHTHLHTQKPTHKQRETRKKYTHTTVLPP